MAMLFAVAAGADVWVTSSSDTKVESAVSRGAMGGINYKTENWSESFCQKNGFIDVVIDGSGGAGYRELLNVAAPGGRIVNYGATAGPPESLDLFKVFWKQLALKGSTMGSPDDFEQMLKFVKQHEFKPIVDRVMSLEEGNEAIQLMGDSPQFGKIVLEVS